MSSSVGQVRFKDGTIKYFRYNGTSDICMPFLSESRQECWGTYWGDEPACDFNGEEEVWEEVEIASSYGNGFYWEGYASKNLIKSDSLIPNDYRPVSGEDWCPYSNNMETVNITTKGLPKWWDKL